MAMCVVTCFFSISAFAEDALEDIQDSGPDSFWSQDINENSVITTAKKGLASWYGGRFHGRKTASGERYNKFAITCASKTLPLGTVLEVTNLDNGRSAIVRVNDRGPYVGKRILDLSYGAAKKLGFVSKGVTEVAYRVVGPQSGEQWENRY